MAKGHDRPGREAKKPKANKKAAPAGSSFLRPPPDKPTAPRPVVTPPASDKS